LTALHLAVYANEPDCVGILLKSGAVPNAVDNVGKTALHDAAYGYAVFNPLPHKYLIMANLTFHI